MITDSGTEFNSERFASFCQEHDLRCRVTSHEAAWQNAKCERHGGILKHMLDKFDHEASHWVLATVGDSFITVLASEECHGLKGGYSPEVLVLGKQTRVAASISGDENPASHLLAEDPRAEGIRFRGALSNEGDCAESLAQCRQRSGLKESDVAAQLSSKRSISIWGMGHGLATQHARNWDLARPHESHCARRRQGHLGVHVE